jgi:hypothetical protein
LIFKESKINMMHTIRNASFVNIQISAKFLKIFLVGLAQKINFKVMIFTEISRKYF